MSGDSVIGLILNEPESGVTVTDLLKIIVNLSARVQRNAELQVMSAKLFAESLRNQKDINTHLELRVREL